MGGWMVLLVVVMRRGSLMMLRDFDDQAHLAGAHTFQASDADFRF